MDFRFILEFRGKPFIPEPRIVRRGDEEIEEEGIYLAGSTSSYSIWFEFSRSN